MKHLRAARRLFVAVINVSNVSSHDDASLDSETAGSVRYRRPFPVSPVIARKFRYVRSMGYRLKCIPRVLFHDARKPCAIGNFIPLIRPVGSKCLKMFFPVRQPKLKLSCVK